MGGSTDALAVYDLSFTKGKPLDLEVRYRLEFYPGGKGVGGPVVLNYILKTGRYWAGTIGLTKALVALDRPLRTEDVEQYGTLPGWTLKEGALYWQWQQFEPDFDIRVMIKNRYDLDLPQSLSQVMVGQTLSRERLIQVAQTLRTLYCGDCRIGVWQRMGAGASAVKWQTSICLPYSNSFTARSLPAATESWSRSTCCYCTNLLTTTAVLISASRSIARSDCRPRRTRRARRSGSADRTDAANV